MPEVNWPEAYSKLEEAYIATLPDEEKVKYFQGRTVKAEEEVANMVVSKAKDELKAKYPAADLEEVVGKTVSELEESFKRSQARNEKAYAAALEKVQGEAAEKIKGLDEAIQAEVGDIFKAWGKTRVPDPEDQGGDEAAKAALREQGVNLDRTTKPTSIDDIVMDKVNQALPAFLKIPIGKK